MKKSILALALALTLVGSLAACSNRDPNVNNGGSGNTAGSGTASGSAGQVSRRYNTAMNQGRDYFYGSYWDDGRYTAGANGQVYGSNGSAVSRDLTRDAQDIVRDAGDALGDIGRGIGDAARDITGNGKVSGTPSWEPDSSAVRQ